MYLSELNWDDVPEDVSVLVDGNDKELNFVKNLTRPLSGNSWYEGDECDIEGVIFTYGEGWYNNRTLLERPAKQQPVQIEPLCTVYSYPIAEWLMKLGYVVATEQTVAGLDVNNKSKEVFICTDFGDITGVQEVIDYVNTNYKMLKISENSKRKAELEAKRLKVLQELSDIDQELNRYGE